MYKVSVLSNFSPASLILHNKQPEGFSWAVYSSGKKGPAFMEYMRMGMICPPGARSRDSVSVIVLWIRYTTSDIF